jgi:hypothetical protein
MGEATLVVVLENGPGVDSQAQLGTVPGRLILPDVIPKAIWQYSRGNSRIDGDFLCEWNICRASGPRQLTRSDEGAGRPQQGTEQDDQAQTTENGHKESFRGELTGRNVKGVLSSIRR